MSRGAGLVGLVLLFSLLVACSEPEPTAKERASWPTVAVIGDSYMAGYGVEDPAEGMAPLVADQIEMQLANYAVGGTGYVDGGLTGVQTYAAQADLALAAGADLYVVEGAANDWGLIFTENGATVDQVQEQARALYARLVDEVGASHVVVVGPVWPAAQLHPGIVEINDVLKEEAERAGIPYLDAIEGEWFNATNLGRYLSADYVHPNAAGHEHLAELIADGINDLAVG